MKRSICLAQPARLVSTFCVRAGAGWSSMGMHSARVGAHFSPVWVGALMLGMLAMSGCVTEISGGMPPPAPTEARVTAQLDLARGYLEQRDFTRARPPLERALEIDPNHVESHVLLAVLLHAQGEYELAEAHYQRALRVEPANAQALNNYGSFLYSQGRFDDALVPLSRLVKDTAYRARSQAFENLGLAHLRAGTPEAARSAFERALALNPRQPRAALELADIAFRAGEQGIAEQRFAEFRSMAKQNARSLCLGLKIAAAKNSADEVASYALALKNLFPEQADACQAPS
ncbi:MAG: type IV pilus biogenesis/stability protein PilW [Pseudomonadota bacterium]